MNIFKNAAFVLFIACLPELAAGASTPLNTLIPGTMTPASVQPGDYACSSAFGPSSFRKRSTGIGGIQEVTFGEVAVQFANSQTEWGAAVYGLAVMTFKTETSGVLEFPYQYNAYGSPPSITAPTFTNYKETYTETTGTLGVSFDLVYPSCQMSIVAKYLTF